jgi:carbamoyl-phosphate synthase large subunit
MFSNNRLDYKITGNILITSISKKVPLLKSVKKAIGRLSDSSLIYGADSNQSSIGQYFVDHFWLMPNLNELKPEHIIEYCLKEGIRYILPTRDGELYYFAHYKGIFSKSKIEVMISTERIIKVCLDKLEFYHKAKEIQYPIIPTYTDMSEDTSGIFVVKDRYGASSEGIGIGLTKCEAMEFSKQIKNPIFQPFIEGEEFSIDLYVQRNGKTKGCIVRKRELIVNGESQITSTTRNIMLENMCSNLAEELGLYGHVMFQVLIDQKKEFHIIECNPRFGGASRLSIEAGLDSFYWFFLEASGHDLSLVPFDRSTTENKLIRYPEDLIL